MKLFVLCNGHLSRNNSVSKELLPGTDVKGTEDEEGFERCDSGQHQRLDTAFGPPEMNAGDTKYIGVNISERKSGTEWTKKRKKQELMFFPPPGGATGTVVHRLDTTPILPELR